MTQPLPQFASLPDAPPPEVLPEAPLAPAEDPTVPVILKNGQRGTVLASELDQAVQGGFAKPVDEKTLRAEAFSKQTGLLGLAAAPAAGFLQSTTFIPGLLARGAERYGGPGEAQRVRETFENLEAAHPTAHMAGAAVGLGSGLLTGGEAFAARQGAGLLARTGAAVATNAAYGGAFGASTELNEEMLGDADVNAGKVLANGLMGGILGGGLGGGLHLGGEGVVAGLRGAGNAIKSGQAAILGGVEKYASDAKVAQRAAGYMEAGLASEEAMARAAEDLGAKADASGVRSMLKKNVVDRFSGENKEIAEQVLADPKLLDQITNGKHAEALAGIGEKATDHLQAVSDADKALRELSEAPLKRELVEKLVPKEGFEKAVEASGQEALDLKGRIRAARARLAEQGIDGNNFNLDYVEKQVDARLEALNKAAPEAFAPPEPKGKWPGTFQAPEFVEPEFRPPKWNGRGDPEAQLQWAQAQHASQVADAKAAWELKVGKLAAEHEAEVAKFTEAHEKAVADAFAAHETRQGEKLRGVYKDKVQIYMGDDALKKDLGQLVAQAKQTLENRTAHPKLVNEAGALVDALEPSFEGYRSLLENDALYGAQGKAQREQNDALSKALDSKRFVQGKLFTSPGTEGFDRRWVADRGKVDTHLKGLSDPKKDVVNNAIANWLDANERYARALSTNNTLEPAKAEAAKKMLEAIGGLRSSYVDAADKIAFINKAKAFQATEGPHVSRSVLGGVVGGTLGIHGALSGAVLGHVAETLSQPMRQIRVLNALDRAAIATDNAVKKAAADFTSGAKAAGAASSLSGSKLRDVIKDVTKLAASPEAMAARIDQSLGTIADVAPKHAQAIATQAMRAITYLAAQAPKDRQPPALRQGPPRYSASDEKSFETKYMVATKGIEFAGTQALLGKLNRDAVDALKNVYPQVFDKLKAEVLDKATDPKANLTEQRNAMLSILFETAVSPSTSPAFIRSMQSSTAVTGKTPPAQPAAPRHPLNWGTSVYDPQSSQTQKRIEGRR